MDLFTKYPLLASLLNDAMSLLKHVVVAVLIYIVGNIIVKKLLTFFTERLRRRQVDETAIGFIHSLLRVVLRILVVVIALTALQIPMASITAVIAAASLSVGLALQGSLANLAGGIILVLFHPFRVGDYVVSSQAEGTVQKIDLLTTSLITPDNRLVLVPNSQISSNTLINVTAFPQRRVDTNVNLHQNSDPEKARQILTDVARALPQTLQDRPVDVVVSQREDASLSMSLRFWVNTGDYWQAYWKVLEDMKIALRAQGIDYFVPSMRLESGEQKNES
ncbi:MAG TPA: mechanosensitive ion channel [Tissierellia bacterium]|nr:mechanosensitive ion channel [Tissierellia bacterium]